MIRRLIAIMVCTALFVSVLLFPNVDAIVTHARAAETENDGIYVKPIAGNVAAVAAGLSHIVVLRSDGTVAAIGDNSYGQCDVSTWRDIIKIWAYGNETFGLCIDGTVETTGNCNLSGWSDIVNLYLSFTSVVGLKSDRTVVATENTQYVKSTGFDISNWTDIVDVLVGDDCVLGLRDNGTVIYAGPKREDCIIDQWKNVDRLVRTDYHYLGITTDGRILWDCRSDISGADACCLNDLTSSWRDVEKIVDGTLNAQYGITKDGRVFGFGGELDVVQFDGHKDIVDLAVGIRTGFALKRDGSVVTYPSGLVSEPELLTGVSKMVAYRDGQMAFLKKDGTVVTGFLHDGVIEEKDWNNIVEIWEWTYVIGLNRNGKIFCDAFSGIELATLTDGVKDTKPLIEEYSVPIAAGAYHSVFIRSDGTVGAVGWNDKERTAVSNWCDVIAVSASSHTLGLRANGKVYATGKNGSGQCNVSGWENIIGIAAGASHSVGLCENGAVVAVGDTRNHRCDVSSWRDIVQVAAGEKNTYGLKANGTVVAVGSNASGQLNVGGWSNISQISAGYSHIVALKADGTVVAAGSNAYGQCDVQYWEDIVAISAGHTFTIGLKSDGTVVATGDNQNGQCGVGGWTNIISISAGQYHTIGMRKDGTYVSVGNNAYGQCNLG